MNREIVSRYEYNGGLAGNRRCGKSVKYGEFMLNSHRPVLSHRVESGGVNLSLLAIFIAPFLQAVGICNTIGAYTWKVMGTTVPGEMSSYFYNHVKRRSQHARGYEDTRIL